MKCCCRAWPPSRRREKNRYPHRNHFFRAQDAPSGGGFVHRRGLGPWEGLTVHELFAQSFIAACSPAFLLENPIDSYRDLNGKDPAAA